MWFLLKVFFTVFLLKNPVALGHEDDVHTIQLTKDTFDSEVKDLNYFVMFFAPW